MSAREIQVRRNSQLFSELCSALLRRGHHVAFRADGASMQPNLQEGDELTVAPAKASELDREILLWSETRTASARTASFAALALPKNCSCRVTLLRRQTQRQYTCLEK